MARGGRNRNLDICMEIALYKVKTKIDFYTENLESKNEERESAHHKNNLERGNTARIGLRFALTRLFWSA